MKKSQFVGFILTLLFGPLGLFYSSAAAGAGFTLASVGFGIITYGLASLLIWPIAVLVGFVTVGRFNARVDLEERRHRELVRARRES